MTAAPASPNPAPARPAGRPHWRRVLPVLVVVLMGGATATWISRPKPLAVVVAEIGRGPVSATVSNTRAGTVEACQRTKLSTIAGGRIRNLAVKEGDRVRKGQLLMQLWNDDQQAAQAQTLAQQAAAERRVVEACTTADAAAREAERQKQLAAQGYVGAAREDAARSEAAARAATCAAVKADAQLAAARVKSAQADQERTRIVAPFDGIVAAIVGEVGEYSTPSPPGVPTPPAIDLIDDSCLYVSAPMDEVDAPKLQPGQPLRINIDALPGRHFEGRVRRIAPYVVAVEKQARTVTLEADFKPPPPAGTLRVGYSADVEVVLQQRPDVLRVPATALQEGRRVLLLQGGQLVAREVKTGVANWEYAEVLQGLAAGDQVVTSLDRAGVKAGAHAVADSVQRPASAPVAAAAR